VTRPIILLGVDGVLNALHPPFQAPDTWEDWQQAEIEGFTITYSPEMGRRLKALEADIHWLTTWEHMANKYIAPLLGFPEFPVLEKEDFDKTRSWWKSGAAEMLMLSNIGRPLIWVDDDISYGEIQNELEWCHAWEGPIITVCPDPRKGITPTQMTIIERCVNGFNSRG
jgi:hypothetical protein